MENAPPIYHVVLAGDDTDHNVLFERVLHKLYPKVVISFIGDGEQLLPFLHLHPVDILFLDLKMPCKSGYQCLEEIRRDPALKALPVTVYSSSAHLSDIQKSFVRGADFYLVKPFSSEHLKKALELLLATDWKQDCPLRGHYFINNRFVPFTAKA